MPANRSVPPKPGKRNRALQTIFEYISSKVTVNKRGCHIWDGAAEGKYGELNFCGYVRPAHIAVYECKVGPVPDGKILRHTCDDPRCVNEKHLIPGTKKDNRRDFMERHPEAGEITKQLIKNGVAGVKRFWENMSPKERKAFCARRTQAQNTRQGRISRC